jgi:hypothetical protein
LLWRLSNLPGAPSSLVGVESVSDRAARSDRYAPRVTVHHGLVEDVPDSSASGVDSAFLTPVRLLEMHQNAAARVRAWLRARRAPLVLYAYGDVLARHGGLEALARETGFGLWTSPACGDGVQAARGFVL